MRFSVNVTVLYSSWKTILSSAGYSPERSTVYVAGKRLRFPSLGVAVMVMIPPIGSFLILTSSLAYFPSSVIDSSISTPSEPSNSTPQPFSPDWFICARPLGEDTLR